jgi:hypothetical protein
MSPGAIEEANRKLVEPPDFDPANSARLGLFVVAQLANRHGIRISLRSSAYGGVSAIVLIPAELIAAVADPAALPPGGPSPSDRSWDRPLVGTGMDDPSRHSLAALQWQGSEELRSVTVPGRPAAINGATAGGPNAGPAIPQQRVRTNGPAPHGPASNEPAFGGPAFGGPASAAPTPTDSTTTQPIPTQSAPTQSLPGGPTPSAVADSVTADGLVQRRRAAPRRIPRPGEDLARPQDLAEAVAALAKAPTEPAPPTTPAPPGSTSAVLDPSTPDGLPRRVRQASLAPQLRAPVEEEADTVPFRSPEQVRELMSALQRGTNRGRLAAQGIDPDGSAGTGDVSGVPGADSSMNGTSGFAEAATVSFSVVQNRPEHHGDEYQGAEHQGGGVPVPVQQGDAGSSEPDGEVAGNHPAENHGTRPDKDA